MRPEVLRFYREFIAAAPDELTTIFELRVAPPLPFLPEDVHGKPIVMVGACYAGRAGGRGRGRPAAQGVRPPDRRPARAEALPALQSMFDPSRAARLAPLLEVGRAAAAHGRCDRHARRARLALTSPKSYCIVFQLGGALARVGEDETAFSQRDAAHNVNINAVWTEDDPDAERHIAWARDFFDAMQPHARGRVYVNFLGDEGADRVRQAYGARKYERLVELKRTYDPTNFFRLNQNIPPG